MINTTTFPQTVTIKCDAEDFAKFEEAVAALKEAGFEAVGKPVKATGILTADFYKKPETPACLIAEAEEGAGGEGQGGQGQGGAGGEGQQGAATLTAEEAAAYNTAKGLTEGQEGYVKVGDPKPADFDTVVHD